MVIVLPFCRYVGILLVLAMLILTGCTGASKRASGGDAISQMEIPLTATPAPASESGGLLYVLDLGGRAGALFSQLTAYDLLSNRVAFTLQIRSAPIPVLSPDQSRFYVADSYYTRAVRGEWRDVLSVYDARSGELLVDDHPIPGRTLPKGAPLENMFLFFSEEGGKLYLVKYGDPPDYANLSVAELDPLSLEARREFVWPRLCKHLIRVLEEGWLCTTLDKVVRLNPVTGEIIEGIANFEQAGDVIASTRSPDGEKIHLTVQTGVNVSLVDVGLRSGVARTLIELNPSDGWVYNGGQFALAQSCALLYIGVEHQMAYNGYPDQIWGIHIADGDRIARFELGGEIDDMVVADSRLFVLSGKRGTLVVFDALTQEKLTSVELVGDYPALLINPAQ